MKQRILVLNHLKRGQTITQAEAIDQFNCYRLSAIINILRKQGFDIETHNERNTYCKGTHARYELNALITVVTNE